MGGYGMARQLASVQKIISLNPIDGADRIEVARVLGWDVVVKKGDFKVGDMGCYIEIDSIVPPIPVFEFMKERKYRVRTIKLRKQVSQGLFMSFNDLGITNTKRLKEGDDLTSLIGITKWEPDENNTPIYQGKGKKSMRAGS
jgi:RNA ligase (TIGR02306 family)